MVQTLALSVGRGHCTEVRPESSNATEKAAWRTGQNRGPQIASYCEFDSVALLLQKKGVADSVTAYHALRLCLGRFLNRGASLVHANAGFPFELAIWY
jgi:hypothetical protein